MQLIYRGHTYTWIATDAKPVHNPRAVNWRYQLPLATQINISPGKIPAATRSVLPRAINWRYQLPTEV
ncbi:MAG: hypothetical protein NW220_11435 [Leptolyngbyaceae cyanobacterium bins.349]|nr:hypothetical protein [Leptolyngbyaceae cyanobacterium bins.349]